MMRSVDESARSLEHDAVEIPDSRLPPPVLTFLGGRHWRLEVDYTYRDGTTAITVPAGFRFDLSSVPRAFWSVIAPFELSIVAAGSCMTSSTRTVVARRPGRSFRRVRTRAPRWTRCSARSWRPRAWRCGGAPWRTRRCGPSAAAPCEARLRTSRLRPGRWGCSRVCTRSRWARRSTSAAASLRVRYVLLPWAGWSTGFRGLIGLVDEAEEESLVITLWADEQSARRSASAGDRLSEMAASASGSTRASLKEKTRRPSSTRRIGPRRGWRLRSGQSLLRLRRRRRPWCDALRGLRKPQP